MIERRVVNTQQFGRASRLPLRTIQVFATTAYALLLLWSYMAVEGVVGYSTTEIKDVPTVYVLLSFALIACVAPLLPLTIHRPSHVALWMLFLTWYVPTMLFTYHFGQLVDQETFQFLVMVSASFTFLLLAVRARPIYLPAVAVNHATFLTVLAIATVLVTSVVLLFVPRTYMGSLSGLLDLAEVYERRTVARDVVQGRSFTGYAVATLNSSLAPLSIVYGLVSGRRLFFSIGVIGAVAIYMLDGTKGNIFSPLLLIALVTLSKRPKIPFGLACISCLMLVTATSLYLYQSSGNLWLSSNIVRRAIVGRATTVGAYFETFRDAPVLMRDSSLMALFGERAVDKSYIVGEVYGGGIDANWNGNSWATMYADFGILGLFIASGAIAVILLCYDGTAKRAPFPVSAAMAGYIAHVWGEAAVTSSILTYGVLVTLVLLSHYGQSSPKVTYPRPGRTRPVPI